MAKFSDDPSICLSFGLGSMIGREAFLGFYDYKPETPWNLVRWHGRPNTPKTNEVSVHADIVIGQFRTLEDSLNRVTAKGGQVINLSDRPADGEWPHFTITVDSSETGRRAGRHFLDRGFRNFAYLGDLGTGLGRLRYEGFREEVFQQVGGTVEVLESDIADTSLGGEVTVKRLRALPAPTALLCSNDELAAAAIRFLREYKRAVPQEVAVLGIDNDEVNCCDTPVMLSSIAMPFRETGRQAAILADRMRRGEKNLPRRTLIPPGEVLVRESSQTFAVDDPLVRAAVTQIYRNLSIGVRVETIARDLGVSARTLKDRFVRALHRTPREEIARIRLGEAARRLRESNDSVAEIAHGLGYRQAKELFDPFRSHFGVTPMEFREQGEVTRIAS